MIKVTQVLIFAVFITQMTSCTDKPTKESDAQLLELNAEQSRRDFTETLEKHLNAVSNKDLTSLKSTMSPEGKMHLILPQMEIISSVDSFMHFHEEWFQDTTWTFETKILHTDIGDKIGIAQTEIIYREPDRNGVPYSNRMIVSYGLEKMNGQWYIIKDHASSIEKSTDNN